MSALKMLSIVILGTNIGHKMADHTEYTPPPQQGFSNSVPYSPLLESRPNIPSAEDAAALDTLVDSLTAEDKTKQETVRAFVEHFRTPVSEISRKPDIFTEDAQERQVMAAFYKAMKEYFMDVTKKEAVKSALTDDMVTAKAFSPENFGGMPEELLKELRAKFVTLLRGSSV